MESKALLLACLSSGACIVARAVADDIRAAGRTITVAGPVSEHIVAGGEEISLSPESSIADWAWLAGRNVVIDGSISRELRAAGTNVTLNGQIAGDAHLTGQRIQIGPGATIGGDFILQSSMEPDIADEAIITEEIIREDLPDELDGFDEFRPLGWLSGAVGFVYLAATLITAVLAVALLFPGFSRATSDRLAATPLRVLGTGLLATIGTPMIIALVFMTGIGLIVGFALLGAYLLALLLAFLLGIIAAAHLGLRLVSKNRAPRLSRKLPALAIASVAVVLILQIPVLNGLIMLLLVMSGLGVVTDELWVRYRQATWLQSNGRQNPARPALKEIDNTTRQQNGRLPAREFLQPIRAPKSIAIRARYLSMIAGPL